MSAEIRLVIDLNHLAYRNWSTNGELATRTGEKTGVMFGVIRSMRALCEKFRPTQIIFCADSGQSFRKAILDTYKASRGAKNEEEKKDRDEYYEQLDKTKAMLECLGIPVIACDGLEADDLCAVVVYKMPIDGFNIVVSGDKDLLQLVNNNTKYFHPHYEKVVSLQGAKLPETHTPHEFGEVWKSREIHPETFSYRSEKNSKTVPFDRWLLYRAMVGDSSDELTGIPGIGEVTAMKVVAECATVDEVVERKDQLTCLNARQKAAINADLLHTQYNIINLKLVTEFEQMGLVVDHINQTVANSHRDVETFKRQLLRYEMSSIYGDLSKFLSLIPAPKAS